MRKRNFYKISSCICIFILFASLLGGCAQKKNITSMKAVNEGPLSVIDDKYRTFYEVFLYSYYDSNRDGIGDIKGLIQKLDYLNDGNAKTDSDLGVNGIWLMPIMPSDSYHKYDVKDYEAIDPSYGTLTDFKTLVKDCHKRGIHLIIDMVMNHTSNQHPWFVKACDYLENLNGKEPSKEECPYVSYYNFSKQKVNNTYYSVGNSGWYYEGAFSQNMPDLNLEDSGVRNEFSNIVDFWLNLGVDGFRMDAAGEYFSGNDVKNIETLSWFHQMVQQKDKNAYIVAEVWQGMDTYQKYYQSKIDSCFNFAFANSDGVIADTLKRTKGYTASSYAKSVVNAQKAFLKNSNTAIDAPFYTNHDMGRSAGYYSGDTAEQKVKIAGAMNLFMSGNAFLYYGEELGMKGAGKDENKRAPMYWTSDKKAKGMCVGPPGMDHFDMLYPDLKIQKKDSNSIYNFYKQTILLRNRYPQIARGKESFLVKMSDDDVCTIGKTYKKSSIAIVYNLSEKTKTVTLNKKELKKLKIQSPSIGGMLLSKKGAVSMNTDGNKQTITLPSYSAVILKSK